MRMKPWMVFCRVDFRRNRLVPLLLALLLGAGPYLAALWLSWFSCSRDERELAQSMILWGLGGLAAWMLGDCAGRDFRQGTRPLLWTLPLRPGTIFRVRYGLFGGMLLVLLGWLRLHEFLALGGGWSCWGNLWWLLLLWTVFTVTFCGALLRGTDGGVWGLILWGLLGAWLVLPIMILLLFFVPGKSLPVVAAGGVMVALGIYFLVVTAAVWRRRVRYDRPLGAALLWGVGGAVVLGLVLWGGGWLGLELSYHRLRQEWSARENLVPFDFEGESVDSGASRWYRALRAAVKTEGKFRASREWDARMAQSETVGTLLRQFAENPPPPPLRWLSPQEQRLILLEVVLPRFRGLLAAGRWEEAQRCCEVGRKLRNWLGRGEGGRYLQEGAAVRFDAAIGVLLAEYWPIRAAERPFLEAELAGYEARPALEGIQLPRLAEMVATGGQRTGWLSRMSGGRFRMGWMRREIQEADFIMRLAGCRHPESLLAVAATAPEGEWYQSLLESVLTNRILIPMALRLKLYAIEHQGQFPTDLRDLPGGRLPGLRMEKGKRNGMVQLYFRCERMNGAPIALALTVGGLTQGENR